MLRRQLRVALLGLVLGGAAFYAGTHLVAPRTVAVHPLTGRRIAGVATDQSWLDRAEREQEEAPERALDLIGLEPGMVVADIGAGSGYLTTRIAARVGPTGVVYANDIQPAMLETIDRKARAAGLANVRLVQGTQIDARLPDAAVDLALMVDVYHEMAHPQEMLRSIRRALKPSGRLVLIEYRGEDPRIPIAPTHRMTVADVRAEVQAEGFTFDRVIEELPRQHIISFRR